MLNPLRMDLAVWRNANWPDSADDQWQFLDNGAPLNIAAKVLKLTVRLREGAPSSALITAVSTGSGDYIEKVDAANGIFAIHIAKATLAALPAADPVNPPKLSVSRLAYDLKVDEAVYVYGFLDVHTGVGA